MFVLFKYCIGYLPVVSHKIPGLAVGVAQVHAADDARRVQVAQVSDVCGVLRDLLRGKVTGKKKKKKSHG